MRVVIALTALAFAGVASAGVASASVAPAQGQQRPVLTLTGWAPMTVHGFHFRATERLVVLIAGAKTDKIALRTDAAGSFDLRVPFAYDKCRGLSISVFGPGGERAGTGIGTIGCGVGKIDVGKSNG